MQILEIIVLLISLIMCAIGAWWLIYDMNEQFKNYEKSIKENIKEDE